MCAGGPGLVRALRSVDLQLDSADNLSADAQSLIHGARCVCRPATLALGRSRTPLCFLRRLCKLSVRQLDTPWKSLISSLPCGLRFRSAGLGGLVSGGAKAGQGRIDLISSRVAETYDGARLPHPPNYSIPARPLQLASAAAYHIKDSPPLPPPRPCPCASRARSKPSYLRPIHVCAGYKLIEVLRRSAGGAEIAAATRPVHARALRSSVHASPPLSSLRISAQSHSLFYLWARCHSRSRPGFIRSCLTLLFYRPRAWRWRRPGSRTSARCTSTRKSSSAGAARATPRTPPSWTCCARRCRRR